MAPEFPRSTPVLISHEVANIGRLHVSLHGVAATFYRALEKDGIISYLKGLDHLGFISKSHPGNHHKRWDYVTLQLFLIQKLKHSAFNTGLTSTVTIGGHDVSNQELMQIFILFANIGHLEGTIATEKALLDFLKHDEVAKEAFLSGINRHPTLAQIAADIIVGDDPYKIKYLIALNYVVKNSPSDALVAGLSAIAKRFIAPSQQTEKLKTLYYKVRRICFVYLDSLHCLTPLQINISKILISIFNYDVIFNPVEHDYDKVLDACETVLTKEMYISPASILAFQHNYHLFKNFLQKYSVGEYCIDFSDLQRSLLFGRQEFYKVEFADPKKYKVLQFYVARESLTFGEIAFSGQFLGLVDQLYASEDIIKVYLQSDLESGDIGFVILHDMRKTLVFFTIIITVDCTTKKLSQVILNLNTAIYNLLSRLKVTMDYLPTGFQAAIENNFKSHLIRRHILYLLTLLLENGNHLNLYIKHQHTQLKERINSAFPDRLLHEVAFADDLKSLTKLLEDTLAFDLPKDITNTLRLLRIIATEQCDEDCKFYASLLPIDIEQRQFDPTDLDKIGNPEKRSILTDIDAFLIAFKGQQWCIYIIEGKDLSTNYRARSEESLSAIVMNSNISDGFERPVFINKEGAKGGFVRLSYEAK